MTVPRPSAMSAPAARAILMPSASRPVMPWGGKQLVVRLGDGVQEVQVVCIAARGENDSGGLNVDDGAVGAHGEYASNLTVLHDQLLCGALKLNLHTEVLGRLGQGFHEAHAGTLVEVALEDVPSLVIAVLLHVVELHAQVLKPLDGFARGAEKLLVEVVVGYPVVVVHAVVDGLGHGLGLAGLLGPVGLNAEGALDAYERAAREAELLEHDGLKTELLGLAGARQAGSACTANDDVAGQGLGGLADFLEVPHAARLGDDLCLSRLSGETGGRKASGGDTGGGSDERTARHGVGHTCTFHLWGRFKTIAFGVPRSPCRRRLASSMGRIGLASLLFQDGWTQPEVHPPNCKLYLAHCDLWQYICVVLDGWGVWTHSACARAGAHVNSEQLKYFELTYQERNYSAAARLVPFRRRGSPRQSGPWRRSSASRSLSLMPTACRSRRPMRRNCTSSPK